MDVDEFIEALERIAAAARSSIPALVRELFAAAAASDPLGELRRASGRCSR